MHKYLPRYLPEATYAHYEVRQLNLEAEVYHGKDRASINAGFIWYFKQPEIRLST
jgi:hypothetical protein